MLSRTLALSLLFVAACKKPAPPPPPDTSDTTTTTPPTADTGPTTSATGSTGDTSHTGSTGDTGTATSLIDCLAVPVSPVSNLQLSAPRAYHDLAFDTLGNVIGSDNSNLIKSTYLDVWALYSPGTGLVQGMAWLADGDLVLATDANDTLMRVDASGVASVLATDVGAYGVIVGPDAMIYVANYANVLRIDPATGDKTILVDQAGLQPRVIDFSPDFTKLYIGTLFGNGAVYAVDLDPVTLDPIGQPYSFATGVGSGAYHDTLSVDYCGNLYVSDYSEDNIYRIAPDGSVSLYIDFSSTEHAHGMEWGNGVGGWREDAIYLAQPYNSNMVLEVVIGVPSADWDGTY